MTSVAAVNLWGTRVGAVEMADGDTTATFQYDRHFLGSGVQLSPLAMPLREAPYAFPELSPASFHGLPGMLADSLPDRFGNALIDSWLARTGRQPSEFNSVDRLCYVGRRAMGGLEFAPVLGPRRSKSQAINVEEMVELASAILTSRRRFAASLSEQQRTKAMRDILLVGTSAGGARAKAVIAFNPATDEVRSGQVEVDPSFEHWIIKFDGVAGNHDKDLRGPLGYGAVEFAYSEMARAAGIQMTECRLLEEGGRRHFLTRRFDRLPGGDKLHMQSLAALRHFDFNMAGAYSYEQALETIGRLGLGMESREQQFRRMTFNVMARNQDDHVKNICFLMDRGGQWSLAPAFDLTYAFNPDGPWTSRHQMSINGKREDFTLEDFQACAETAGLGRGRAKEIVDEVAAAVSDWRSFATQAGVEPQTADRIGRAQLPSL